MINVFIYVKNEEEAKLLAAELLQNKLVAHISIDFNNHVYSAFNGEFTEEINCLITAQTKALLFQEILDHVEKRLLNHVKIYSAPIAQCNSHFSEIIRSRTKTV
ncbi:MAG: divalent cation tolerance protein CutA [Bacteroidia bacterium]|jgi:uncharacterized protein involved in tolerance to divalent cations|nr:divalent cation tolerance protein CutA [Bacteroidia bacterium]